MRARHLALTAALLGCTTLACRPPERPAVTEVCEVHDDALAELRPSALETPSVDRDLDAILEQGTLRVALSPDPTSWFLDGKRLRGFEYDLIADYARSKGLALELVPVASAEARLLGVEEGRFDVAAGRLDAVAHEGVGWVPVMETGRVLIQSSETAASEDGVVELSDLVGRRVHALGGSRHAQELEGLGFAVELDEDGRVLEDVGRALEPGELWVARSDLAQHLADEVVIGPELPGASGSYLAVCEACVALQISLENWLVANERKVDKARTRYLESPVRVRSRALSSFDTLFRTQAARVDWSWTLLAAQAWQESRFRPHAVSPAGAQGLMQIMPVTAEELGVEDPTDPAQSVRGAVDYLRRLDRYYRKSVPDDDARVPFVLAAYNAGMGHVDDARRLASFNGRDDQQWDEVAPWMLALASREWNRHPVVRNGYCRGEEPVEYVANVMNRGAVYDALLASPSSVP